MLKEGNGGGINAKYPPGNPADSRVGGNAANPNQNTLNRGSSQPRMGMVGTQSGTTDSAQRPEPPESLSVPSKRQGQGPQFEGGKKGKLKEMYTIEDLVASAVAQKPGDFEDAFSNLMLDKLGDAIADRKLYLAQTMFNDQVEIEEDEEEKKNK